MLGSAVLLPGLLRVSPRWRRSSSRVDRVAIALRDLVVVVDHLHPVEGDAESSASSSISPTIAQQDRAGDPFVLDPAGGTDEPDVLAVGIDDPLRLLHGPGS